MTNLAETSEEGYGSTRAVASDGDDDNDVRVLEKLIIMTNRTKYQFYHEIIKRLSLESLFLYMISKLC
jgi:hypothetical protein